MTTPTREIKYDRASRDFACYLGGELVCYARSYTEGETTLDALVLELIQAETFVAAQVAEVLEPIEVHNCPNCGESWDLLTCQVCGWTLRPLVLARPAEVAEVVYTPACTWGGDADSDITTCACGQPAAILLHGVCDDRDIALCDGCHAAYSQEPAPGEIIPNGQGPGESPGGGGEQRGELPAGHRLAGTDEAGWYFPLISGGSIWITDAPPLARPVAPPTSATLSALASTPHIASAASDEPLTSDRPAVALLCIEGLITYYQRADGTVFYTVPGDLAEHAAISWPARETHCQHLTACASSICPACVPPERAPFRCPLCATNEHRATACPEIKRERERQIEQAKWGETMFWLYRNQRDILQHSLRTAPQIYSERAEALALYLGDTTGVFVPVPMVERHLIRLADAL